METTRATISFDRVWHLLDQAAGLVFLFTLMPVVLMGLSAFRTLSWVESPFYGEGEGARFFLVILIATIVVHAALFAIATYAAFSEKRHVRLWTVLGVAAFLLYIFGFVWPYLDRVWAGVSEDGSGSLGTHLSEQARLLLTGGLLVTELGPFLSGSLILLTIRGAIAAWSWRTNPPVKEREIVSSVSARDAASER